MADLVIFLSLLELILVSYILPGMFSVSATFSELLAEVNIVPLLSFISAIPVVVVLLILVCLFVAPPLVFLISPARAC